MRRKRNYAMMKLATPKRVTFPNGGTIVARYKRTKRSELPPNYPYKLERAFFKDLKKQFAKLLILDGTYSSGHFTEIENIFFERIYQ